MNTGIIGEDLAAEELAGQGYEIIQRNWKNKVSEIDIVAKKKETIYFVEVKYRSNPNQGDGFDYITDQKIHHMNRAAELWVLNSRWQGSYELLVVAIDGESKTIDIREVA